MKGIGMKKSLLNVILLSACVMIFGLGCAQKDVKKVGMVIQLKPEYLEKYKEVHADDHPGVRHLLSKYHMKNFNIFLHKLDDGNWYEFGFYEYHGKDFEADMAMLDKEEENIKWLEMCDPMQQPLKGYKSWAVMERVYYNP